MGLKLVVPEVEIVLYKHGFVGKDLLGRAKTGKRLSELVEKIDDPMVIALDGAWGSGKSLFLKMWVGEHTKEFGGTAKTVYFDAFKNDYLDDPLIALTGEIVDRFKGEKGRWEKARPAVAKISRAAVRLGVAAATQGLSEVAGAITDAVIKQGGDELADATEKLWEKEDGRRVAMKEFEEGLIAMTYPDGEKGEPRKIVIVIDELDRCRPDYALSLLEVIKHFFAVPHVHFVLGVNLVELQNSVRARYGAGIDAAKYLQKFVHVRMPIRPAIPARGDTSDYSIYFEKVVSRLGIADSFPHEGLRNYLAMVNHHDTITLRDIEKICTLAVVTPTIGIDTTTDFHLFPGLLILQIVKPEWIELARRGELPFKKVESFFKFDRTMQDSSFFRTALWTWKLALEKEAIEPTGKQTIEQLGGQFMDVGRYSDVSRIISNCLDSFHLDLD